MENSLRELLNSNSNDYFIPQSAYKPSMFYYEHVSKQLPNMWRLNQGHFWTQTLSPKAKHPAQGWKIHVSALPESALRILNKVASVCFSYGVEFKFASDPHILISQLRKSCSRQSAGKFITIYPGSDEIFKRLIESLYAELKDEKGPYILSDRQYKDASVLFYRYGGIQSFPEINVNGERTLCILNDKYEFIEDIRSPYFILPDFVTDELCLKISPLTNANKTVEKINVQLFGGKYEIISVIKHSNAGGVYKAKNVVTQQEAIIKECRPYVEINDEGVDSIERLKKEFRILSKISKTEISAEALDFFEEWNHSFMAQELIEGQNLRQYIARSNKLIHATSSDRVMKQWFEDVLNISVQLFEKIILLHEYGIVFGDLSLNNIIVNPGNLNIKLIDFEGAFELGVDRNTNMFSPGFGKHSRKVKKTVDFYDDYYALGSFLMAMILPNPTLSEINEDFVTIALGELRKDIGLPYGYIECVNYLYSDEVIDLGVCVEKLKMCSVNEISGYKFKVDNKKSIHAFCENVVSKVFEYNANMMDVSLSGRILPFGPKFDDCMAVDHGVLGVAYAWHKASDSVPDTLNDWILRQFKLEAHLPGLMNGLSGMAWALFETGHQKLAGQALKMAAGHRLLFQKMSLAYGAAGYGLACLNLWQKTNKEHYLSEAVKIADIICETAMAEGDGCSWDNVEGKGTGVGLMEGASGIALFLLNIYCATKNARYLLVGENGIKFDISCGREIEGTFGFPKHTVNGNNILYPYLAHGSAGVASVALRYYVITKNVEYLHFIEKVKPAIAQKYTISPDLFSGLSGLANYMLDVYEFLGDESYLDLAYRAAEGLKLFTIKRKEGFSYPLLTPNKICTDYSSGSAGVALFMNRLINHSGNFNFMTDELIKCFHSEDSDLLLTMP
ncbi:class III lanthionine synthetase LanKC [Iodobacter fluviatilis]|uniref:Lanthionine synthetase-like protein n=1 Tax=Iodobacter fluviatilis TaxID=537 RepID=A0A377Q6I7_9NEIS|nr:class III lanthionine synthetase LanKC [Iodobacter fluviatilis]TCU87014.1 lanthionine synthetase-like protein [Iodobacter fluviatilis]STQ90345.1 serine/threonine protein kinase [Iodobacter fluviatilis]